MVVQLWADWELLHLGRGLYELLQLSRSGWNFCTAIYATDDTDALNQVNVLRAAAEQKSLLLNIPKPC